MTTKRQLRVSLSEREEQIVTKVAKELDVKEGEVLGSVVRNWLTGMILNKLSLVESNNQKT